MDTLPTCSLQSAAEHGVGFSTLRLNTAGADLTQIRVGEIVAVVARTNVRLGSVLEGKACTHHRVDIVNPLVRPGRLTIRVSPKIPPHFWKQVTLVPVRACREFVAAHPDQAIATVPTGKPDRSRGRQGYRSMRPVGSATKHAPMRPDQRRGSGVLSRLRDILFVSSDDPAASSGPAVPTLIWQAARTEHDRVHREYLAYEVDPELVLLYPAVTDVTIPESAAFHDAGARAQALRTEAGPAGPDHADAYHHAVAELARRWRRCEENGRRLGHSRLPAAEAAGLDKAIKLIRHARSADTEFERAGYLNRAQQLVTDLLTHSDLLVSPAARTQLENLAAAPALTRGDIVPPSA